VAEDRGRPVERQVGNDAERLVGKFDRGGVGLDDVDVRPATAKVLGQARIELYREDPARCAAQLCGESAAASSEIEHELIGPNTGVADELRRQRLRP
jgi:hypothetical protein